MGQVGETRLGVIACVYFFASTSLFLCCRQKTFPGSERGCSCCDDAITHGVLCFEPNNPIYGLFWVEPAVQTQGNWANGTPTSKQSQFSVPLAPVKNKANGQKLFGQGGWGQVRQHGPGGQRHLNIKKESTFFGAFGTSEI